MVPFSARRAASFDNDLIKYLILSLLPFEIFLDNLKDRNHVVIVTVLKVFIENVGIFRSPDWKYSISLSGFPKLVS